MSHNPSEEPVQTLEDRADEMVEDARSGCCPFCGHDPYHYVHNGIGMERVAIVCCDEGIAWHQNDSTLKRIAERYFEAINIIDELRAQVPIARAEGMREAARIAAETLKQWDTYYCKDQAEALKSRILSAIGGQK